MVLQTQGFTLASPVSEAPHSLLDENDLACNGRVALHLQPHVMVILRDEANKVTNLPRFFTVVELEILAPLTKRHLGPHIISFYIFKSPCEVLGYFNLLGSPCPYCACSHLYFLLYLVWFLMMFRDS